jgi:hypothetical protein
MVPLVSIEALKEAWARYLAQQMPTKRRPVETLSAALSVRCGLIKEFLKREDGPTELLFALMAEVPLVEASIIENTSQKKLHGFAGSKTSH